MQAAEDRDADHLAVRRFGQAQSARNALVNPLMGSSMVKVGDIFTYNAPQMTLTQDEHIIQTFASQIAQEPLAKRVRARRFHRGFQNVDIHPIRHMLELRPILAIIVPDEKARSLTKGRRFP